MLNGNVIKVLKENMWSVATCDNNQPHVVPIGFKDVLDDGTLAMGAVLATHTIQNIQNNAGKVAISAYDPKNNEGYQVKGEAEYLTQGSLVEAFKKKAEELFKGTMSVKGVLRITPAKVIVTTPGPDNNRELAC